MHSTTLCVVVADQINFYKSFMQVRSIKNAEVFLEAIFSTICGVFGTCFEACLELYAGIANIGIIPWKFAIYINGEIDSNWHILQALKHNLRH